MLPGEHQQVLSNLQSHFEEFLEDCEESEVFTVADCAQLERDVAGCKEYYQELLKSAERGKACAAGNFKAQLLNTVLQMSSVGLFLLNRGT